MDIPDIPLRPLVMRFGRIPAVGIVDHLAELFQGVEVFQQVQVFDNLFLIFRQFLRNVNSLDHRLIDRAGAFVADKDRHEDKDAGGRKGRNPQRPFFFDGLPPAPGRRNTVKRSCTFRIIAVESCIDSG